MQKVDVIRDIDEEDTTIAIRLLDENNYDLVGICRASECPKDDCLYYIIGRSRKFGSYTSWLMDVSKGTLYTGKYGFKTHAECLLDVLQNRITYMKEEN